MSLLQNTTISAKRSTLRLTTSQNVTAPKPIPSRHRHLRSLTTSQNVTAPKRPAPNRPAPSGLTTSQNVTAPKLRDEVYKKDDQRLTDEQFVEVERKVKVDQHEWLKKNAERYGFAYE